METRQDKQKVKGYQILDMANLYRLRIERKLSWVETVVYLALRGLSCRFGRGWFHCKDSYLVKVLNTNIKTIQRCRLKLQEKGLILFNSGGGQFHTEYRLLEVLVPLSGQKCPGGVVKSVHPEWSKVSTPINKSNHKSKQEVKRLKLNEPKTLRNILDTL